jgi:hypothetical protein
MYTPSFLAHHRGRGINAQIVGELKRWAEDEWRTSSGLDVRTP